MKSRIFWWSIVSVLVLGIAAGAYWWFSRPQVIVLNDGSRLTLLAVTYGKHHKFPKAKIDGRKVRIGTLTTTNDSLCVWVDQKHDKDNWPNYQLLTFDGDNTGCGESQMRTQGNLTGGNRREEIVGLIFEAFPRRGRKIYFRAQEWNSQNGQQNALADGFTARNPAPRSGYPKWTPDILPVSREDDDLRVTLTRVEFERNTFNNGGPFTPANDPRKNGVLTAFRVEQKDVVVTNWQPVEIETSDATGNRARSRSWSNRKENDEQIMTYQWGLWPDEPAWKLRIEMSRQSGFMPEEMWTVSDLPLKVGDINNMWRRNQQEKPFSETTLGERKLKVFPVLQLSAEQARNYGGYMEGVFRINVDPQPEGMRLTVVKVTDDQGKPIEYNNWGWGGGDFRFSLKKLAGVKSVNVTMALHRSRYFEFTVKPPRK